MNPALIRHARAGFVLAALTVIGAGAADGSERFELDPVHTRIVFEVSHLGLSQAIGTFRGASGVLHYDPERPGESSIEVRVPVASLDLGEDDWNARMLERVFFHAERHPEARFRSTAVTRAEDGRLRIEGELTLRGSSQPVVAHARLNARKRHPYTLADTLGFSATMELERADFGIVAYPNVIGTTVRVRIEAEAIQRDREEP